MARSSRASRPRPPLLRLSLLLRLLLLCLLLWLLLRLRHLEARSRASRPRPRLLRLSLLSLRHRPLHPLRLLLLWLRLLL